MSCFKDAEMAFQNILESLYKTASIDYATYAWFSVSLEDRLDLAIVSKMVPQCLRSEILLDLGCGMGALEVKLSEKGNLEAVGLDLNREYVHLGLQRQRLHGLKKASFVVGDMYNVPFREGVFNLVVLYAHTPTIDIYKVIKENVRILKRNGTFMFDAPMKGFYDVVPVRRPPVKKYNKKSIIYALQTRGFIVEQILLSAFPPSSRESFHVPYRLIRLLSRVVIAMPSHLQKLLSGFWFSAMFVARAN